jgi:hypothetical protein
VTMRDVKRLSASGPFDRGFFPLRNALRRTAELSGQYEEGPATIQNMETA